MTFDMYKCKTCKENCKYSPDSGQAYCLVDDKWELRSNVKMINDFTQEYGCASHSDFQNQKEKVLGILNTLYTDSLFLSDGSFECNAICDKIHGVLAEIRKVSGKRQ